MSATLPRGPEAYKSKHRALQLEPTFQCQNPPCIYLRTFEILFSRTTSWYCSLELSTYPKMVE
jgi:hypothetical protein